MGERQGTTFGDEERASRVEAAVAKPTGHVPSTVARDPVGDGNAGGDGKPEPLFIQPRRDAVAMEPITRVEGFVGESLSDDEDA